MREGVVRFEAVHRPGALPGGAVETARTLSAWRTVLFQLGLVGEDPARYGGAGYGNVSARVGPFPGARGARAFLVSGTQTGGDVCSEPEEFALVRRYDAARNRVESEGTRRPSSESMTHGAVYDLGGHLRWVFHGHSPAIWRAARALRLPTTARDVDYGTPEMAWEVGRLARETPLLERRVFAMGGHEDGVVAFGRTADEAAAALLSTLAAAYALGSGAVCAPVSGASSSGVKPTGTGSG